MVSVRSEKTKEASQRNIIKYAFKIGRIRSRPVSVGLVLRSFE